MLQESLDIFFLKLGRINLKKSCKVFPDILNNFSKIFWRIPPTNILDFFFIEETLPILEFLLQIKEIFIPISWEFFSKCSTFISKIPAQFSSGSGEFLPEILEYFSKKFCWVFPRNSVKFLSENLEIFYQMFWKISLRKKFWRILPWSFFEFLPKTLGNFCQHFWNIFVTNSREFLL